MKEIILFLLLSVGLSTARNVITKKTAVSSNTKGEFYLSQTTLFFSATVLLAALSVKDLNGFALSTAVLGVIYGVLLVISQWMLTRALKLADTSVCSVIYSLGFLLPTVSGVLFYKESIGILNALGIAVAIAVILIVGEKKREIKSAQKSFFPFIILAMLASGGLGIMQKIQQSSEFAEQKAVFLTIAFLFATLCSLIAFLKFSGKGGNKVKISIYPVLIGLCFGSANYCNTFLAGKMKSAVFFPLQNISTILFSTVLGIFLFKERLTIKKIVILLLGIAAVLLLSI